MNAAGGEDGFQEVAAGTARLVAAIEERLAELAGAPEGPPSAALAEAIAGLPDSTTAFASLLRTQLQVAAQDFELTLHGEEHGISGRASVEVQVGGLELAALNLRAFAAMLALRDGAAARGWL